MARITQTLFEQIISFLGRFLGGFGVGQSVALSGHSTLQQECQSASCILVMSTQGQNVTNPLFLVLKGGHQ